jgi:hypothetical protein
VTVTPPFWRYDVEAHREHRHLRRPRLIGAQATVQEDEGFTGSLLVVPGVDTVNVDVLTHLVPPVSRPHFHATVLQVSCGIALCDVAFAGSSGSATFATFRRRRPRLCQRLRPVVVAGLLSST